VGLQNESILPVDSSSSNESCIQAFCSAQEQLQSSSEIHHDASEPLERWATDRRCVSMSGLQSEQSLSAPQLSLARQRMMKSLTCPNQEASSYFNKRGPKKHASIGNEQLSSLEPLEQLQEVSNVRHAWSLKKHVSIASLSPQDIEAEVYNLNQARSPKKHVSIGNEQLSSKEPAEVLEVSNVRSIKKHISTSSDLPSSQDQEAKSSSNSDYHSGTLIRHSSIDSALISPKDIEAGALNNTRNFGKYTSIGSPLSPPIPIPRVTLSRAKSSLKTSLLEERGGSLPSRKRHIQFAPWSNMLSGFASGSLQDAADAGTGQHDRSLIDLLLDLRSRRRRPAAVAVRTGIPTWQS
jgi:hypothetical protein